jgi:hypothetical protein
VLFVTLKIAELRGIPVRRRLLIMGAVGCGRRKAGFDKIGKLRYIWLPNFGGKYLRTARKISNLAAQ